MALPPKSPRPIPSTRRPLRDFPEKAPHPDMTSPDGMLLGLVNQRRAMSMSALSEERRKAHKMDAKQLALKAVDGILADLTDRGGLRQEWEQIDRGVQAEIKEAWARIIEAAIRFADL